MTVNIEFMGIRQQLRLGVLKYQYADGKLRRFLEVFAVIGIIMIVRAVVLANSILYHLHMLLKV
jgi:hypothetical protein